MKKKLLGLFGICIVLALFYQEILLVGCKIALNCFLPKTFSYQKISWDKNVLRIQGLIKEKNELSVDWQPDSHSANNIPLVFENFEHHDTDVIRGTVLI